MTRFSISMDEALDFILKVTEIGKGSEIFIPKLTSYEMPTLIEALGELCGEIKQEIVGIRPGEKLHEKMIPRDDSYRTLEFEDHYVITPSIKFSDENVDYNFNNIGEVGSKVEEGFSFNSAENPHFLSVDEIKTLHDSIV